MTTYTNDQLNTLVDTSLGNLKKDRDKGILRRRGGINIAPQTLEQIGNDLNITRERVRQIEKAALARIREIGNHDYGFISDVMKLITKKGGLISLDSVNDELGLDSSRQPHAIFLIRVNPKMIYLDRNDHHQHLVGDITVFNADKIKNTHEMLIETVKQNGKPAKFEAIYRLIDGPHSMESLAELAKASNYLSELDGNWGLNSWPEVNPKSIRDKIYLVLTKSARPLHFSEIAERISVLATNPKQVTTQAVHNELIKDGRFVLIGRGIYALGEWGYRSGTVADIIEEVLNKESGALNKDEIIKRVLAMRQVKATTIVLNLQEKPQFIRVKKGIYALASI